MTIGHATEDKKIDPSSQISGQLQIVGNLTAALAHELKNSLAGLSAGVEVLLDELVLSHDQRSILIKMGLEVRRVESLIKDFMSFTRPPMPQCSRVSVNSIVENALTISLGTLSNLPERKSAIKILRKCDDNLPIILADPVQLQQVFVNLLTNAFDAMPEGGILTVETTCDPAGKTIAVSISDTGTGIRQEYRDKIFEPFFTTKSSRHGLGLSISRRFIEQNSGSIRADSNPGGGAIFSITLPINISKGGRHEK